MMNAAAMNAAARPAKRGARRTYFSRSAKRGARRVYFFRPAKRGRAARLPGPLPPPFVRFPARLGAGLDIPAAV